MPIPSFFAEPWRGFLSLLQIILLTGFGFPASASPLARAGSRATGARASSDTGMLASLKMSLYQFRTKAGLATRATLSALNPPSEFDRLRAQFEEPLIATGPTSAKEDKALLQALRSYRDRAVEDDFTSLRVFLSDYPRSAWCVGLLTNLGLSDYHYGYFSKAIDAWTGAWQAGRGVADVRGRIVVDRALAELARMHARLGHADALEALFKDMGDRKVTGSATEILTGARDGLWMMRHDPGVSYLCGPMALKNLLMAQGSTPKEVQLIEDYRSGSHGVTFEQVRLLAAQAGFNSDLVHRLPGQPVPMPSIVHWKVNHFAALLGYANGRYHVQDPTFGTDLWITSRALDSESSGYFLVSRKAEANGWKPVSSTTAQSLFGMGYTNQQKPGTSNCSEGPACSNMTCNSGLCGYAISPLTVSLNLTDTPVGYAPPIGPSVKVSVSYNQREDSQPATFAWFNVSPKWTLNFLTYIQDDPHSPGSSVTRYIAGGGSYAYYGYSGSTQAFTSETNTGATLVQTSASPVTYTRTFPDGHQEIYSQSNGATSYPRLVFISKTIDPAGNALTYSYDSQLRLASLTDATGRNTTFSYELTAKPLLVTTVTDPFGRSAHFSYDSSNRLNQITDVLGLKSQFTYDASSLINAMTTPYGTTTFAYSDSSSNPTGDATRYLNATDPLGHTERMEYNVNVGSNSDPANTVPTGMNTEDAYLYYRDTYYWDKHAYAVAPGNYSMAKVTHWCHWSQNSNYTSDFVESSKSALENRVWFNYPGQGSSVYSGTYNKPTAIGRVLDDGTSQVTQMAYNAQGNITQMIDPVGRQTQFTYAANGLDMVGIKQKTSASGYSTLATMTYNGQHLPLTMTDAAGQTTTYTYNNAGQPLTLTDALGQKMTFNYDGLSYLTSVVNANNQTQTSFTYDNAGRVATRMDSEGYTVAYQYDAFDRPILETYPDGTTRQYSYNRLDLASVTDRQGRTTLYSYDANRQLVQITDPLQRQTKFGYFENGTRKSLTDPNGNTTSWAIDVQNRVTGKTYANGKGTTNTYEATTSRLKSVTDALAQVMQYSYTQDDQLAGITYSHPVNSTPNVSWAYDPYFVRPISMTDGSGTTNYTYQPIGALGALQRAQEAGPYNNSTIGYQYDQLGRLATRTVAGSPESFSYDPLNRLTTQGNALGTFDLGYLGQTGQLTSQQARGGMVGTQWTYDSNTNDRRLKAITNSGATRSFQFTTTPENLISQINEIANPGSAFPSQSWNYSYDDSDRLTSATSSLGKSYSYGYDPADNIASQQTPNGSTSRSYNNLNQIVADSYDANGNLLDDGQRTYTWDAENRLLSVTSKTQVGKTTAFRYDGLDRRIAIVTNGTEVRYLWCGEQLCQARSVGDVVTRRYFVQGELIPSAATQLYYAQDQLGSVRDVVAAQNGSRVAEFDYDPYGNPTQNSGRISTDFRYGGLFLEQNSGLYLASYRVYDSTSSRWLSRDPIHELGGYNLYSYVNGAPIRLVDPDGRCPTCTNKKAAFVNANLAAATQIAAQLDVPVVNILGLAAEETGYGTSPIARKCHDFFGIHPGGVGSIGSCRGTPTGVLVSGFPSTGGFLLSGQAFAAQWGAAVKGISDPDAFAAAIPLSFNSRDASKGGNPDFNDLVSGTIAGVSPCLK